MDSQLLPDSMSTQKKTFLKIFVAACVIFMLVSFGLSVEYGTRPYHTGFVILALCLLGLSFCTLVSLYWISKDNGQLDDKHKYLLMFQSLVILTLCVGLLITAGDEPPPCPQCVCIQKCLLNSMYGLPAPQQQWLSPSPVSASGSIVWGSGWNQVPPPCPSTPALVCAKKPDCFEGAQMKNFTVCIQPQPP